MVLSEAIREFCHYARHELRRTDATWRCYAASQRHFGRWLADQGLPDPPVRDISANLFSFLTTSSGQVNQRLAESAAGQCFTL